MSTLLLGYRRRSCPSLPRGGPLEFVIEYLKWRRGQPHIATTKTKHVEWLRGNKVIYKDWQTQKSQWRLKIDLPYQMDCRDSYLKVRIHLRNINMIVKPSWNVKSMHKRIPGPRLLDSRRTRVKFDQPDRDPCIVWSLQIASWDCVTRVID